MHKQLFVNLAVKDLKRSMEFFTKLGYSFNPQFTDDKAASLVLGDNLFAMLITEPFFKTFIPTTDIADAKKVTEVLNALSVDTREQVDELVDKAIAAGGTAHREPSDYGWMYSRAYKDLDGHIWEIAYMDLSKAPVEPGK